MRCGKFGLNETDDYLFILGAETKFQALKGQIEGHNLFVFSLYISLSLLSISSILIVSSCFFLLQHSWNLGDAREQSLVLLLPPVTAIPNINTDSAFQPLEELPGPCLSQQRKAVFHPLFFSSWKNKIIESSNSSGFQTYL